MSRKIYIVIPTYNERDNIGVLVEKLFALNIEDLNVLVVDDGSPDGTGKFVEELAQTNEHIKVLHRTKKEGLGKAYIAGFRKALELGADLIFEMDADLSHDPSHMPAFLEKINECDIVLGSRYMKGGGIKNWNFVRRMISRFGNLYARTILGLPYHDLTGGFKCFRRHTLEKIDLDGLDSLGYNFQIEMTYVAHKMGFTILETPIVFTERAVGKSKFNLKIMLEGFWRVVALRFKSKK